MGDRCEIFLEKTTYTPGEIINGRVQCTFIEENKATEIRVTFVGRAKVQWKNGKTTVTDRREYFNMVANLLSCETTFPPGSYSYPFRFNLPDCMPSSVEGKYGNVRYKIRAVVDRPWALDYESTVMFVILSCNNLRGMPELNKPMEYSVQKKPFTLCSGSEPIQLWVNLQRNGFTPGQLVVFSARLRNNSGVRVNRVTFKIIQGLECHAHSNSTRSDNSLIGQEFTVAGSTVFPGQENSWDLELKMPVNVFTGTLQNCQLINSFCKLKVKVFLPAPHYNFKMDIPLVLGTW